jgi:hypothetical protein
MSAENQLTVVGVFGDDRAARSSVYELESMGFTEDQVGYAGHHTSPSGAHDVAGSLDDQPASGAVGGGALGGLLGAALAGLGTGAGPLVAIGVLAAAAGGAAAGAAVGGILGSLTDIGLSDEAARNYEEQFRDGRSLVVVKAGGRAGEVKAVLVKQGASVATNRA